ncbi:MAG TPA: hypothetical protein VHA75_08020 [Rugosimonospora sp.]|nr:hypothetical protein [Rugosimonospora sp.]
MSRTKELPTSVDVLTLTADQAQDVRHRGHVRRPAARGRARLRHPGGELTVNAEDRNTTPFKAGVVAIFAVLAIIAIAGMVLSVVTR